MRKELCFYTYRVANRKQKQTQNQNTNQPHPKAKTTALQLCRRVGCMYECKRERILERTAQLCVLCRASLLSFFSSTSSSEGGSSSFHSVDTTSFFTIEVGVMNTKICFPIFLFYWISSWAFRVKFSQVPSGNGNHNGYLQSARKIEIYESSVSGYSASLFSCKREREGVVLESWRYRTRI